MMSSVNYDDIIIFNQKSQSMPLLLLSNKSKAQNVNKHQFSYFVYDLKRKMHSNIGDIKQLHSN